MPKLSERKPLPYAFEWAVDQGGYEIVKDDSEPSTSVPGVTTLGGSSGRRPFVRELGGPVRMTRPLVDEPALWRDFGEQCVEPEALLKFVTKHGLPFHHPNMPGANVNDLLRAASTLREIGRAHEVNDLVTARNLVNDFFVLAPYSIPISLRARIVEENGKFDMKPVPRNLLTAMLVQAADAITGMHRYRRCPQCSNYFAVGKGYHSVRRDFCSNSCRVAAARKRLKGSMIAEGI